MGHSNNNMGAIGAQQINKGYNYNSNGIITSIIGTQHAPLLQKSVVLNTWVVLDTSA